MSLPISQQSNEIKCNRFNPFYIRFLFTNKKNKNLFIDFINAVFVECRPPCVAGRVIDFTFEEKDLPNYHLPDQYNNLDFSVVTDSGQRVNIELQTGCEDTFKDIELYYFSRLYSSQQVPAFMYEQLNPVVVITLFAQDQFPEPQKYIRSFSLREDSDYELMTDKMSFIFIEANKCQKFGDENSRLTKWMTYLNFSLLQKIEQLENEDKVFAQVISATNEYLRSKEEMLSQ